MIRENLSVEEHKVDVEKMIVKQKFNNLFNGVEDDYSINSDSVAPVQNPPKYAAAEVLCSRGIKGKGEIGNSVDLDSKWEESSSKMAYNIGQ